MGSHIQVVRYRLGLSSAVKVRALVTCSGVLIRPSPLHISVNIARGAPEAESEKKRAICA